MADVIVVGGGAAGMLAAWRAAQRGARVTLLEKKNRLGTKILISGGGKCNLTHAGEMEEIRRQFRSNEAIFLKPSFYRFTNDDFLELLTSEGLKVYTRPDGRIFPVPPTDAKDVVEVLERQVRSVGVKIRLDCPVEKILVEGGAVTGVQIDGKTLPCSRLIVAVGGSSFPGTGCTGDGWKWLMELGHTIVKLTAALAPLYLDPTPPEEWSGVALRDCILRARKLHPDGSTGKERMHWRGDLLFTHKGVSGPTALGVSREVAEALPEDSTVEVDLYPDESFEQVTAQLMLQAQQNPKRTLLWLVEDAPLPERLRKPLLESAKLDPAAKCAQLNLKDRNRLANTLKGWQVGRVRAVPLERGEVVAGGVALDEVDSKTMESRKIKGLYLCGEVLDIAGPVGGYNLQAAWSTGVVAGDSAAQNAVE
nr:NAD(P)/FAD-dependent oxidoreductase [Armatimonas sp.]